MTRSRVDLHTPAELSQQYVDAIDVELREIDERVEQLRLEWMTHEDRRNALVGLRTRHLAALQTLEPPTTLHDLVEPLQGAPTA